jgi:sigma-B regulation protein RsbU (phosphoserine phosphatase)
LADIRDFYLDEEQKARLERMSRAHRTAYMAFWLARSLFLKLTPIRRVMLLAAVYSIFLVRVSFRVGGTGIHLQFAQLGGALLVFILMLELKDKLLARSELAEGRAIQRRLLPDASPLIPGWDAWLYSRPANDVGGDLVDCIRSDAGSQLLALGDVSGKGLPAALLMAKLQATIRALCCGEATTLAELGGRINRIFRRDGISGSFATLAVLELYGADGAVRLLNAGHTPPLLVRGGIPRALAKGGAALGLLADAAYSVVEETLAPGDLLLVYSDGINEARNADGECFGNERVAALVAGHARERAAAMGQALLDEVQRFIGEARPDDDQTLLVLRRVGA